MISKRPSAVAQLQGMLLFLLFVFSPAAFAESNITFLGTQTDIADRDFRQGRTLSGILDRTTARCETIASNTPLRNTKNEAKKRLRIQVKCLKQKVRSLNGRYPHWYYKGHHKRGHKHHRRAKRISNNERKTLIAIIKQFKEDGGVIVTPPVDVTSTINGRVTTPAGMVLADISVSVGEDPAALATTDANGLFNLELKADAEHALKFTANGYATQVIPAKSPTENGTINLDITMIARGSTQTFSASSDTTLTGSDGASVAVTANSFVDSNGDLVDGDIQLTITPVDVSSSATLGAFPGEFAGIQTDTTETPIISLGVVEYKFTKDGEELQLDQANGATADILIPIYIPTYQDGSSINIGDEIPLWSLNETTGIWLQEGTGLVVASADSPTGLAMQATVSHFTWWNCDVSMNAGSANVTVTGSSAGTATIQATAAACNIGWRPTTVETVINIGQTASNLSVPSSCEVCYSAKLTYASGETANTNTQCASADPSGSVNISLLIPNPGPLAIAANGTEDSISVNGVVGFAIDRVQLASLTAEDSVTYSIVSTQTLPAGLSINPISATQAEIVGIPTEGGSFTVEIQGIDATGSESDVVTVNYSIVDPSTTSAPLFANDLIYFTLDPNFDDNFELETETTFDLSPYNIGETATNWSFEAALDGNPVPTWFSIDSNGLVEVTGPRPGYENWRGLIRATNAAGSATTAVQICTGDCVSNPTPIPGDYVLSVSRTFARENELGARTLVSLNQISPADITVSYATEDGTAIAGEDYIAASGTVTIPAGSLSAEIVISLINDSIEEDIEQFSLNLTNPSDGVRLQPSSAVYTIFDDDQILAQ